MYRDVQKVFCHCNFFYIFYIKPHFCKILFQSQFLFDFDEICTNKSENVCSFCDYFIIFLKAYILNIHSLNTNLNDMSSKVLSLYCLLDVQNFVLCLTCELLKSLDNKIMLKSQCKTTFKHVFVCKKFIKKNSPCNNVLKKNVFLYEIYIKTLQ